MNTICRLISTAITLSFILTLSAQLVCGSSISASTGSNKCITQIQYNHLNLPSRITYSNGRVINYVYSASGTKLKVTHKPSGIGITTTTDYVNGYIFTNNSLSMALTDNGYYTLSGTGVPIYHFYLKDHQGNNRVVVSQSGSVEQINHYYPYGALFAESTNGDVQRFKYNGKELDRKFGLNWYDHGARHNDAAIGRWHCIDKNAEKYYGISPYAYCGGDPVNGVDLNGEVTIFVNGFRLLYAAADMTSNPSGGKKSVYQKTDIFDYWDDKIIEYYKKEYHETDETMYFTSGSSYPTSSASLREKEGEAKAMIFNDKVLQGEFSVDKKEPIRLVSHSQGGATAAGMAAKLKELGYNVEIIEYITPHQATDIHHPKGVKGIQYDQKFDRVVDDDKKEIINGIDPNAFFEDEKHRSSLLGGHSNSDNLEIIKNGAKYRK